jgi:hypothetical protein
MARKNREERRHERFGGGRASEQGGWPTSRPNPIFGNAGDGGDTPPDEVVAKPRTKRSPKKAPPPDDNAAS